MAFLKSSSIFGSLRSSKILLIKTVFPMSKAKLLLSSEPVAKIEFLKEKGNLIVVKVFWCEVIEGSPVAK
jgi:hypothetical protein